MTPAEQARDLIDAGRTVTLDGRPAKISGFLNRFATIWERDDHARSVEYPWETVVRLLQGRGDFKS